MAEKSIKFHKLTQNDKLNTSYPVKKEDWLKYRKEDEKLNFNEDKLCFYLHIPFCQSKCKFCEYVKYVKDDKQEESEYINILISDIKEFLKKNNQFVLYGLDIGGGTPTILENENLEKLLNFVKGEVFDKIKLSDDFESSIEGTFASVNEEKIKIISHNAIKRISFGLQTVNKKFLKDNDRPYPPLERMVQVLKWCEQYGIKKVNIDLMYGLKNQSKKDLRNSIATIEYLKPSQVTLYEFRTNILNIKENKTKVQLFNEYKYLFNKLTKLGYKGKFGQNTFSFYDDLGCSSYIRNRMVNNISYKGFGISAQSKNKHGLSYNIGKTDKPLLACLKEGSFIEEDIYVLPKEEMLAKYIAISGYCGRFNLKIMEDILNENPLEYFDKEFEFLLSKKLIKIEGNEAFLTRRGFLHYGAVLSLFYPQK